MAYTADGSRSFIPTPFVRKVTQATCGDLGSDVTFLPPDHFAALGSEGADMDVTKFRIPPKYGMVVETDKEDEEIHVVCDRSVSMNTELHISHGTKLTLRNVMWVVAVHAMPEPLQSRPLFEA